MSSPVQRVHLLGGPGSGKTTAGRPIADALELPFVDLDDVFRQAGWGVPEESDFRRDVQALRDQPRLVCAGNYGSTWDVRFADNDTVIFFSLPATVCVRRIVARSFRIRFRGRIDLLPINCQAGPDHEPFRDYLGFLRYTWRFPSRRAEHMQHLARVGIKEMILIDSTAAASQLVSDVQANGEDALVSRLRPLSSIVGAAVPARTL
ncbi:MAG: shikimate kinase [Dehalococcoidia bacterium]